MPLCIAIILGGVGIGAYSNEIASWMSKKYNCSNCNSKSWTVEKDTIVSKISLEETRKALEYLGALSKYERDKNRKHLFDFWYNNYFK